MRRPYIQKSRAAATSTLRAGIVMAFYHLLIRVWIDEITLDEVAANAGTTRRTVIRMFGGKEGLLRAAIVLMRSEGSARFLLPDDVVGDAAIEALVAHYETVGSMTLRLLAQEDRHPVLREALDQGRLDHRVWLAGRLGDVTSRSTLGQLIVATDVYAWKLLRHDLGHTSKETESMIAGMVARITGRPPV